MKRLFGLSKQLVKYSIVAVSAAGADWVVFFLAYELTGMVILAQGLARLTGGGVSFVLNKGFSFRSVHGPLSREIRRFLTLYCVSYVASLAMISFGETLQPGNIYGVKLSSDLALFVFNFFIMKYYVFDHGKGSSKIDDEYQKAKQLSATVHQRD